jgi:DNA-directed RNA polymerase specialized sigma24 family protein
MKTEMIFDVRMATDREQLFTQLYRSAFPAVAKFVSRRNGTWQDAKDIFHDALVILYEKIVSDSLAVHLSHEAYLMGIAKHLWIRKFKRDKTSVALTDDEAAIELPRDHFSLRDENRLLQVLEAAGRKCLEMLRAFYYDNERMDTIARKFGFGSTHSATVQKFKCLEKVRETVKQKSIHYEDFTGEN